MNSYMVDTNWYTNMDATDHITSELNRLVVHDKYNGNNQIKMTRGAGMDINYIGHALYLNQVLHVHQANKNLVSVCRLVIDNHVFLEFHLNSFFIKDKDRRKIMFHSKCEEGFYPILSNYTSHVLRAIKPTIAIWHDRL
ncbi:hypothetical protein GUJ93_ZPchr0002g23581 [Zizania palustris]|uniref:Uncharacterized protein n=1 Tax=Zizania palustris TaxID=103762 RepID=A0A8J5S6N8_ZIZPA|nr:hypothetical protein GUJ93_ZPchr0002g23581 [Zizania palustris]